LQDQVPLLCHFAGGWLDVYNNMQVLKRLTQSPVIERGHP
jgi:hypothetical protein